MEAVSPVKYPSLYHFNPVPESVVRFTDSLPQIFNDPLAIKVGALGVELVVILILADPELPELPQAFEFELQ